MQKTFEKHWTKADLAEDAGNYPLARLWLKLTKKQLELDNQYAHPAIIKAIDDQIERVTEKISPRALLAV